MDHSSGIFKIFSGTVAPVEQYHKLLKPKCEMGLKLDKNLIAALDADPRLEVIKCIGGDQDRWLGVPHVQDCELREKES